MDSMAAHGDWYSPRYSCTILTARSRTSGESDIHTRCSGRRVKQAQSQWQWQCLCCC